MLRGVKVTITEADLFTTGEYLKEIMMCCDSDESVILVNDRDRQILIT